MRDFPSDGRFCHTGGGDPTSVELGLKFTSSKDVDIVGVRVYRTDAGPVTGSLWAMDGTRRATAAFAVAATHRWQNEQFSAPVPIQTGQTHIASYFAPNPDYAFEYGTFTSGPYHGRPDHCPAVRRGRPQRRVLLRRGVVFPRNSAETNYWVTPLWAYRFTGFYQPVDNGLWNTAKAGSAIPVKFSLGGNQGLDVIKPGSPTMTGIPCANAAAAVDAIEETVTASQSGLSYDATSGHYVYVWKTDKGSANKCYRFDLGLNDGTSRTFNVAFPK